MATQSELILVKTNIGGLFFDAVLRSEHTSSLNITQHPVETGAAITDYAYRNPEQLVMDISMSDVITKINQSSDQFGGGDQSRSVNAYQLLKGLQNNRVPVSVVTKLNNYDNMLIETIVSTDTKDTQFGLKATVTLKEIFIVYVTTVKISARPQTTDGTNGGNAQPIAATPQLASVLYSLMHPGAQMLNVQ
jgi:hypothetical protein